MAEKGMLYDLSKCIGCRACQVACKQWNELSGEKTEFFGGPGYQNPADLSPQTWTLVKFKEVSVGDRLEWLFRQHQCLHCGDAACIAACPVRPKKAMTRDEEYGFVYIDQERCIGCGACQMYCPFSVPKIDEKAAKSTKCNLCMERVRNGLVPACAKACATGAITFGDRKELRAKAEARRKELVKEGRKPYIYGLKQLDGLGSLYIMPDGLKYYDLPETPKVSEDLGLLQDLLGPFSPATVTAALVGLALGYIKTVRAKRVEEDELVGSVEK